MTNILPLTAAFEKAGLDINLSDKHQPDVVDYIVYAPNSPVQDFTPYTRCKAVLNLWAGVEAVVNNPTLTVPLTRMVDHGLTRGMVEWVAAQTLRHHLNLDLFIHGQSGEWLIITPPPWPKIALCACWVWVNWVVFVQKHSRRYGISYARVGPRRKNNPWRHMLSW